jgi:hypothetical protein
MPATKERPDTAIERLGPSGRSRGSGNAPSTGTVLLDQYRTGRARLIASTLLLERALDLLELLTYGVDLDDASELVRDLVRDVDAERRRR